MIQLEFTFLDEIPTVTAPAPVAEIQEPETLLWDFPTEYADPVRPWNWVGKPDSPGYVRLLGKLQEEGGKLELLLGFPHLL